MIAISRAFLPIGLVFFLSAFIGGDSAHQLVEEGNTFYVEGRYQDALAAYGRAELAEPKSGEVQYNLGNVYFKQFELARATESYKRALLLGNTQLQTLAAYNLGNIRYQQSLNAMRTFKDAMRHIKISIRYYRESLLLDPNFPDARYNLELAYRLLGELEQQGIVLQRSPEINDRQSSVGRGRQMDMETPNPSTSDTSDGEGANEQIDEMNGQAGEKAPQGSPASNSKSESQPAASPRSISAEEAAQMAELVRDKALAAESQRQQWKRARMRDAGEAKTW